jgi:hypothetical protein
MSPKTETGVLILKTTQFAVGKQKRIPSKTYVGQKQPVAFAKHVETLDYKALLTWTTTKNTELD